MDGATDWLAFTAEQVGLGTAIGVLVGAVGMGLLRRSSEHGLTTPLFDQFAALALAVLAFVLADHAGGNGFIAAFVGGLAAGRAGGRRERGAFEFAEEQGQLLSLAVFFMFGAVAIGFLADTSWQTILYAVLSLTLIRMLPVALAVAGMGFRASSVALMGWFGPRGLASIILALVVANAEPDLPALGSILAVVTCVVVASVFLHGVSAQPLVAAYARGGGAER